MKVTIMVVDDQESMRSLLKIKLELEGYHTLTAADGQEALDIMADTQHHIEVMLLDVKMPGLSGFDVLEKVRLDHPDICVIMVTALADSRTAVDAIRAGAYDYITKPFDLNDVTLRVERARERRTLVLRDRQHQDNLAQKLKEQKIQMENQFVELMQSLAREHGLVIALESLTSKKDKKAPSLQGLPEELRTPKTSVQEFASALRRLLKEGGLPRQGPDDTAA